LIQIIENPKVFGNSVFALGKLTWKKLLLYPLFWY
jgi:hypothetical protein